MMILDPNLLVENQTTHLALIKTLLQKTEQKLDSLCIANLFIILD